MFGQNREKKRFSWRWAVLLVALVAGSLLLAACGDSDPSPTATPEPTPVQATPDKDDDTMMDEDADAMMDEDADAMMVSERYRRDHHGGRTDRVAFRR